jgi:hypothetical protein
MPQDQKTRIAFHKNATRRHRFENILHHIYRIYVNSFVRKTGGGH